VTLSKRLLVCLSVICVSIVGSVSADTPKRGGSLVFARNMETNTLNPMELADNGQIYAHELIFDTLVFSDPTGATANLVPGLAEEYSVSDDLLSWKFKLRDNARFSDGSPVTSEDVQFSFDRFSDPEINTILPGFYRGYSKTEIVDDKNFIVHLDEPIAAFLTNISVFTAYIVPKDLVQSGGDAFWEAPVGSGPFKVKEWIKGTSLTFERNPYYWEEGKPYLDELRYDFIKDDNARILKLRAGEADAIESYPWLQIKMAENMDGVRIQSSEIVRQEPLWLNHKVAPLGEVAVRQALSYATDRETLRAAVFGGVGSIPNHMIPKMQFNASTDVVPSFEFNLEKARAMMAESTVPNGFDIEIQFPAGSSVHKQIATVMQAQWSEIGVNVNIVGVDETTIQDNLFSYNYEISMPFVKWTSDSTAPDTLGLLLVDSFTENSIEGLFSAWANRDLWDMVNKAVVSDDATRQKMWPEIQAGWVADMPWINLLWLPGVEGISDRVHDLHRDALGVFHFENTWVD
jgi:peptide/nickel transport system substrate-binding protein